MSEPLHPPYHFSIPEALAVLTHTPDTLDSLLRELRDVWLDTNEGPQTFSPRDVVAHLIHGEKTDWIPRASIILIHGESQPFTPFDRFAHLDEAQPLTIGELLDTFARLRQENVATLEGWWLTPAQLDLTGCHPEFGMVTLRQHLATWVAHDMSHLAQIARVVAKRYDRDVGPWKKYLSVLNWK